jgi:deoxyribodipyrimidine photo-lyase
MTVMNSERIVLWHWKYFDLAAPQYELEQLYVSEIKIEGLITSDSMGSADEQATSFLGIPRISAKRYTFYQDCIDNLVQQYEVTDHQLTQSKSDILTCLKKLSAEHDLLTVWYPLHIGTEEESLINWLKSTSPKNITFKSLAANTLISSDELPFSLEKLPETFSGFRRKIEKRKFHDYLFARYPLSFSTVNSPGRARLQKYIFNDQYILNYKITRNGLGPGDYSSRVSKWLAAGAIQAAEVGAAILEFEKNVNKNESTYWLLFELLWRDFFHHLHRKIGNLLFAPQGMKRVQSPGIIDSVTWHFPSSNYRMEFPESMAVTLRRHWTNFRCWALGNTGVAFIDTMMRELYFTGEMSNRARQCAASYLIHDLHIPWWWGAQWFEYLLLDYDVSSNWGNWAYIAGVGADSRPVRKFNIAKQAQMYDPQNKYQRWGAAQNWVIPDDALPKQFPGSFH